MLAIDTVDLSQKFNKVHCVVSNNKKKLDGEDTEMGSMTNGKWDRDR